MAAGIWVRLMHKPRIEKDITIDCSHEAWQEALETACKQLDVSRPLILNKHERDWEQFSQARFLKEHFVEDVPFDRMEVEFIDPDQKKELSEAYKRTPKEMRGREVYVEKYNIEEPREKTPEEKLKDLFGDALKVEE